MGSSFEFALVGRGVLATSCAQQILDRGLPLRALVSSDPHVLAWAARHGLASGSDLRLLGAACAGERSVLLSVSNDRVIPADVLGAFRLAVNFHDGPLPRYSGSHATSWALMAREREYSITWHRMTSRADAGEILLQVAVALAADETAFSLNGKCHQAALASFPQLLDGIVSRSLAGRPQNLARRVFYARDRRPERLATLDFRRPAQELEALARALSYGGYANRLAVPKLWTGQDFIAVREIDVEAVRSCSAPGTVLNVGNDAIEIATSTHDVRLRELTSLDGETLDREILEASFALRDGVLLPCEGAALEETIAAASPCSLRDEELWVQCMRDVKPLVLPFVASPARPGEAVAAGPPVDAEDMLVDVVGWLARMTGMRRFDVGLEDPVARGPLVAPVRPFAVEVDFEARRDAWRAKVASAHHAVLQRGPYLRDAVLRYPSLASPVGWKDFVDWPVVIGVDPGVRASRGAALRIRMDPVSGSIRLESPATGVALGEMAAQLQAFRAAMVGRDVALKDVPLGARVD